MKYYVFLITFFLFSYVKGQTLYHDNYIKINGYIDSADGSLLFQIENISDSVIILNAKNINFENVRAHEWAADLSLLASDLSLLKPSFGHFMNFKRLIPKTKYTAVAYDFPLPKERNSFILYIQIDYVVIPKKMSMVDNILYDRFIKFITTNKLEVRSYIGELEIKSDLDNCYKIYLQDTRQK